MIHRLAGLTAAAVLVLMLVGPVGAQSGASVHLEITGGAHPGIFDVETGEPCVAEDAGGWSMTYYDDTLTPTDVELHVGTDLDSLLIMFDDGKGYLSVALDPEIVQADGRTILSVTAPAGDLSGLGGDNATIDLRVDCGGADGAGAPAPTRAPLPTPRLQGPPEAGSTVFHLTLDFGPWAGTYDAWTLDDACFGGEDGWSAFFLDPGSIPSSVSLIIMGSEGEGAPVGVMSAFFGALPDTTLYETSDGATIELDAASGTAHVSDTDARATAPDLTSSTGGLDASIECASA